MTDEGALLLFAVLIYCTSYVIYVFGALRAARSIHNQLIKSVLGTTLRCVISMVSFIYILTTEGGLTLHLYLESLQDVLVI
jgi:hypothetical protein